MYTVELDREHQLKKNQKVSEEHSINMDTGKKIHDLKSIELTQDTYSNTGFDISGTRPSASATMGCVG
jgi:DNA/RNA-binding domain of Phe-tRNA-synthetase-like protein